MKFYILSSAPWSFQPFDIRVSFTTTFLFVSYGSGRAQRTRSLSKQSYCDIVIPTHSHPWVLQNTVLASNVITPLLVSVPWCTSYSCVCMYFYRCIKVLLLWPTEAVLRGCADGSSSTMSLWFVSLSDSCVFALFFPHSLIIFSVSFFLSLFTLTNTPWLGLVKVMEWS